MTTRQWQQVIDELLSAGAHAAVRELISAGFAEKIGDRIVAANRNPGLKSQRHREAMARYRAKKSGKVIGDNHRSPVDTPPITPQQNQELSPVIGDNHRSPPAPIYTESSFSPQIQDRKTITTGKIRKSIRSKCRLPDDFELTPALKQKAQAFWKKRGREDLLPEVQDQFDSFTAHHRARGTMMECWESAWQTWYANAIRFSRPLAGSTGAGKQFVPAHEYTAHQLRQAEQEDRRLALDLQGVDHSGMSDREVFFATEDLEVLARGRALANRTSLDEAREQVQKEYEWEKTRREMLDKKRRTA
jgi:hypothetical protein